MKSLRITLLLLTATACQTLTPMGDPDTGPRDAQPSDSSIPSESGPFIHTVLADGVVETVVDATSETVVQYLDLETGLSREPAEPLDSAEWDLGFRRYFVTTNGGASGSGGAAAARLPGIDWEAVIEPPATGWMADAPDIEEDEDTGVDTAFNGGVDTVNDWYDYDATSHRLSPRDVTFVVRSVEGNFFKVQILAYYDTAGTPGVLRFRWARIMDGSVVLPDAGPPVRVDAGPDAGTDAGTPPLGSITIDASSRTDWTYYRVGEGVVTVADPATSMGWDLAFRRTAIQTNSASSGTGLGGARSLGEVAFAAVSSTDTVLFVRDEITPPATPGGEETSTSPILSDWFDYDIATHAVSPKPLTYAVRTATGGYAKLRIWSWTEGVFTLQIDDIEAAPEEHVLEVDASAADAWAYVDLDQIAGLTVADASSDQAWDLGLMRTNVRTSSGPSGPGEGGALDLSTTEPVATLPTEGYVLDSAVPLPGPPGSGSFDGNSVLSAWYDYDPVTHAVSPRATTFAVRLSDGSLGRVIVDGWTAGVWHLRFAYAGPGRSAL